MAVGAAEIRERLARRPLVLDGAMGTELERRGVAALLPLWSAAALLECPPAIEAIHRDYVTAGADIIVANTFRTNPRTLERAGRAADGAVLNRLAVELARRAAAGAGRAVIIAAGVAPVEDCYSPQLVPDESTLGAEHEQMMAWLADAGADLVWIETMNAVGEARAAAVAAAGAELPFAVSFVTREDGALLSGERLEDAVAAVEPFEPVAIGVNCIPPRALTEILPRLRRVTERPLSAYAHINNVRPTPGWSFAERRSPEEYAADAARWVELGARIVGGCCGTTPAHIQAVRGRLGNLNSASESR